MLVITRVKQIKTIKDRTANVKKQSQTGWRHAVSGTFVDCPWEYQLLQPLLTVSTKTELAYALKLMTKAPRDKYKNIS